MKINMKKLIATLVGLGIIFTNWVHAGISESFQKVLSLMNIPSKNVDGYEINEQIYEKYALLVYGSPSDITNNQRWKDTSNGKWKNEQTGRQGEYRILGYNIAGTVVNNEAFPDDYTSGISPEQWNYIVVKDALASWNDTEKYQTKEQYEYMLTQNLSRKGITYQLNAQKIGLDKARIETYATWKTAGSIFTKKIDAVGAVWEATFHVPPMAADAKLNASLNFNNGLQYQMQKGQETLEIPFSFGAEVTNLGGYAKKEDIHTLYTEVEVNNNLYDRVEVQQETSAQKNNTLVIHRADYPNADKIEITIRNTSVLETRFQAETPFVDIKEVTIEVQFSDVQEEKYIVVNDKNKKLDSEIPRPVFQNIRVFRKSVNGKGSVVDLFIAKKTNTKFICAGQALVIEMQVLHQPNIVTFAIEGDASIQKLDSLTKRFVYDEPKARGETLLYSSLTELKDSYQLPRVIVAKNGVYHIEYIIPYGTKQTLHSWSTLREESKDAMKIDTSKLFSRIRKPYQIKLYAKNAGGSRSAQINLDVFERWDTVYNRNLKEYVK